MDVEIEKIFVNKNFMIYNVLLEVLEARGYVIPSDQKDVPLPQFQAKQENLQKKIFYRDNEDDTSPEKKPEGIAVYFNFSKMKITSDYITKLIKSFAEEQGQKMQNVKAFLIIAPTSAKTGGMDIDKNALTMTNLHDDLKIQFFKDQDLMFNVLKHDLVPEHILLSEKKKKQLLKYYNVKESQLPKLLHSDPVAKFLGLKRGQVVKIIRKSQTAGLYTTYRVVV